MGKMDKYEDKEASMDDYSHKRKLEIDAEWDKHHGHKDWARNDEGHEHALEIDAHYDHLNRESPHPIIKHSRKNRIS